MSLTHQIVNYKYRFNQDTKVKSYKAGDRVSVSDLFHSPLITQWNRIQFSCDIW